MENRNRVSWSILMYLPILFLLSAAVLLIARQAGYHLNGRLFSAPGTACVTNIGGTLTGSQTWDSQHGPYCLTSPVTVDRYATLIIQPGVTVMAQSANSLVVQGRLIANGTVAQPVIFTSTLDNGPGQWVGLVYDGTFGVGRGTLTYTTIRYAGQNYYGRSFDLGVLAGANVSVTNSTIASSSGEGVLVDGGSQISFTSNTLQNNGAYPLSVPANAVNSLSANTLSGNTPNRVLIGETGYQLLAVDSTWRKNNGTGVYEIASQVTVQNTTTLTLEAGVEVMTRSAQAFVVQGTLLANGTAAQPVVFTSTSDSAPGQWVGLVIDGTFDIGRGTLTYTTVRYAGQNYYGRSFDLGVYAGASVNVSNSKFASSQGYGVFADGSTRLNFQNNDLNNNAGYGMYLSVNELSSVLNNRFSGNSPNRILIRGSSLGEQ